MPQKLRCIATSHTPFQIGQCYEVAEILEHPGHAMVRKPNGKWPRPGDPYFGWHADDIFAPSRDGIPAYSCGYRHVEHDYFGTMVPHSVFPVPARRRSVLEMNKTQERIDTLIRTISDGRVWWLSYHHVLRRFCFPDTLESKFLLIGVDYRPLSLNYSYRYAETDIRAVLRRLGIPFSKALPIEEQSIDFWCRSWRSAGPWKWSSRTQPGTQVRISHP